MQEKKLLTEGNVLCACVETGLFTCIETNLNRIENFFIFNIKAALVDFIEKYYINLLKRKRRRHWNWIVTCMRQIEDQYFR